jgi:acetoin utilization protein AcuB
MAMDPSIKSWMSGSPISIEAGASAVEAHDRMVEYGIRHLPVLDSERRVVGVLSIDDLRAALPLPLSLTAPTTPEAIEAAREWAVGDVMSYAPQTIREGGSLREAADRMADHHIGCLPVVDEDGRLVAMLTETDLLRALATRSWIDEQATRRDEAVEPPEKGAGLDQLVDGLRRERTRIAARLDLLRAEERALTDELVEQPMDAAEAGADLRECRLEEGLERMAARRLEAIDRALDHAAQGRLSVCDDCGGAIPVTRLRAVPGTTLCVWCASERQAGLSERPRGGAAGSESEAPLEPPLGGGTEPGGLQAGSRVYTREFGEGVLVRIAPFGTCPRCGDVEGERDPERDEAVCASEGCGRVLEDVNERATVAVEEQEVFVDPGELRGVDPAPYD